MLSCGNSYLLSNRSGTGLSNDQNLYNWPKFRCETGDIEKQVIISPTIKTNNQIEICIDVVLTDRCYAFANGINDEQWQYVSLTPRYDWTNECYSVCGWTIIFNKVANDQLLECSFGFKAKEWVIVSDIRYHWTRSKQTVNPTNN